MKWTPSLKMSNVFSCDISWILEEEICQLGTSLGLYGLSRRRGTSKTRLENLRTNLRILFNKFHFISSMLPCTSTWIGPTTFIVCSTLVPWQSCVWRDLSGEDVFFLMRFEGPFCTSRRVPKLHRVFHSQGWLILEKDGCFFICGGRWMCSVVLMCCVFVKVGMLLILWVDLCIMWTACLHVYIVMFIYILGLKTA